MPGLFVEMEVSLTTIFLLYASQVAGITDMSQHSQPLLYLFLNQIYQNHRIICQVNLAIIILSNPQTQLPTTGSSRVAKYSCFSCDKFGV
jgi:hypothetical protein